MNRPSHDHHERYAIGIDIGGTFTDCAVIGLRNLHVQVTKVPTTPHNPSIGFFAAIDAIASQMGHTCAELLARTDRIVHGTTHGTNAVVARHGVKVGLIATAGHGDMMTIMKGGGRTAGLPPDHVLHTPSTGKPEPYVPKRLVVEVPERIDSDGDIVVPLDEAAARERITTLLAEGVEAIAISLLWSIRNPVHEQRLRALVHELAPQLYVCCAHELGVSVGEYPRTTAAILNAYIGPLMMSYVSEIETGIAERGYAGRVLFAQCAGGAITGDEVRAAPIRTLQSGPVSGIVASAFLGRTLGSGNIICADMGGTTLDVAVIHEGQPMTRTLSLFERFQLALPMLDLESIGAGGGSIAWIDASGGLQVGPRSAGSVPGPACYGKGGLEATVTDADVVLGLIDPETFLHGRMKLDRGLAEAAIDRLADKLGMSRLQTAAGISRLVDSRMADLIQRMTTLRGFDPRDFTLYAFGGGGPVHGATMAAEAGITRMIVPLLNCSAVWSAFGAATSDVVSVAQQPVLMPMPASAADISAAFATIEQRLRTEAPQGLDTEHAQLLRSVRMRYSVQVHDVEVPLATLPRTEADVQALINQFHTLYEQLYGTGAGYRQGGVTLTAVGLRLTLPTPKPALSRVTRLTATRTSRPVYWAELGRSVDTPVLRVHGPGPAGDLAGPLLIELPDTVVTVRPGQSASFDDFGNLVLNLQPSLLALAA